MARQVAAVHGFSRALFEQHPLTFMRAKAFEDSEVSRGEGNGMLHNLDKVAMYALEPLTGTVAQFIGHRRGLFNGISASRVHRY
ncbi:hypothetical protein [Veronia pacifica]|uniref:hypothetical protein n=1 Tax=Veronia pacifica TaxID=1080227 RepID=UPI001FDF7FD2|nr:hypothetical protein [Veronia pacifica]